MARDPECSCRKRAQDFVLGYKSVEPGHALIAGQDGHLAIAKRCDIGIRFDRQVANASGQCTGS